MRGFLEIRILRVIDVQEFTRIPVDVREPGAQDLHHDAMAFLKLVENVVECDRINLFFEYSSCE